MPDLDQLGKQHRKLLADLEALKPLLADAIREERDAGATYVDLMQRSGYRSIEVIRQILNPQARDKVNKERRRTGVARSAGADQ